MTEGGDSGQFTAQETEGGDSGMEGPLSLDAYESDVGNSLLLPLRRQVHALIDDQPYSLVEERWLNEPFAIAAVIQNDESLEYEYFVIEPTLGEHETELYKFITDRLRDLKYRVPADASTEERAEQLNEFARKEVRQEGSIEIADAALEQVLYYVRRDHLHYERIDPLVRDPLLASIAINGADAPVYVQHRDYGNMVSNIAFEEGEIRNFARRLSHIMGTDIASASPVAEGTLPNGAHVEMALGEVSANGGSISIKKFQDTPLSPIDLINIGALNTEQMAYLWLLIENGYSGLIAGGAGSGKTTTLNTLSMFLPLEERVVSVEQTQEIQPAAENWTSTLTREGYTDTDGQVGMEELVGRSIQKRPDTLIVGEFVGDEATEAFKALNTGISLYGTTQAQGIDDAFENLTSEPLAIDRSRLSDLGFLVVLGIASDEVDDEEATNHTKIAANTKVRRAVSVVEIEDANEDGIEYREIYSWNDDTGEYDKPGQSVHTEELRQVQHEPERAFAERYELLEYLRQRDINGYDNVATAVRAYMSNPRGVIDSVRQDDLNFEELRRSV